MNEAQKDRLRSFRQFKSTVRELFEAGGSDNDKVIITDKISGEVINVDGWYKNLTERIMEQFSVYEQSIK